MDKRALGLIAMVVLVALLYGSMFSLWMIDVSFGALSVDGCITQGPNCLSPMLFYHHYLRILTVMLFGAHLLIGALLVLLLAR